MIIFRQYFVSCIAVAVFFSQISIGEIIVTSTTCEDDANFLYGEKNYTWGWENTENDDWGTNLQNCKDWVALDRTTRCTLKWEGKSIEEHCPATCALVRYANAGCSSDGKGMLFEKCQGGIWTPGTCIKSRDRCGDVCKITNRQRAGEIMDKVLLTTEKEVLSDVKSAQYLTYDWIVNEDEKRICPDDDTLIQRYVLALIYFQLGGQFWQTEKGDPIKYLNGESECFWHGVTCDDGKVTKLLHNKLNATGNFVSEIAYLENLVELDLFDNYIAGTIPPSIADLRSLKKIDFDYNHLTGILPDRIYEMTSLERLDIDNNYFVGTVSDKIGQLSNLITLSIYNCSFVGTLPESIGNLKKLLSLSLDGNNFDGSISRSVCDLFNDAELKFLTGDCAGNTPKIACDCCTQCY
mmetsp:Transcript_34542/g.79859  ORF Transcript_34542/g.79859 Transcript_34542/m.79859 type:complete len:408 (-) Transcript_34542:1142-2365(-)